MKLDVKRFTDNNQYADPSFYWKEINYLSKKHDKPVANIKINDQTFGEPVVFINGEYFGYLDDIFYAEMERGIPEEYFTPEVEDLEKYSRKDYSNHAMWNAVKDQVQKDWQSIKKTLE
jgi:hypothetical protein